LAYPRSPNWGGGNEGATPGRLTELNFGLRPRPVDARGGVVLGGNPLIDGGAEKAPGVADFEGGNLFRFDL